MTTAVSPPTALSPEMRDFYLVRHEDRSGPFTLEELRQKSFDYAILPEDRIEITGKSQYIPGQEFIKIARLLPPRDPLVFADCDVIITRTAVVAKTRRINLADTTDIRLILPTPPRMNRLSQMDRTLVWIGAILLIWTFIAPVVAWYITRSSFKEDGLGAVHGLEITGSFEPLLIKDGLGILKSHDPKLASLTALHQILRELHQGHLRPS